MSTHFEYSLGSSVGHRANLGLVVLQSDETLEYDLRRMLPTDGVALYTSRVPSAQDVSNETLAQMEAELPQAASLLPPETKLASVAYGCTSGTAVIGAKTIHSLIKGACDCRDVTEPVSALCAAADHLGVQKIAFLSPYVEEVSAKLRTVINSNSLDIVGFGSFNEGSEAAVARIDGPSIIAAAVKLAQICPDADAVFLSCTNLQTLDVISKIEDLTGKICFSSNQVLGWHLMRLANITVRHNSFGLLFKE